MSSFFVTAIGTDIGKTYISASLLRSVRDKGQPVSAIKPLMSGFGEDALDASDAGQLLAAMGRPVTPDTVSEICMHRFEAPLAPNVAMRRAGVVQDYEAILAFARRHTPSNQDGLHLVEGAGGLMSPVTDAALHIDFIADLGLPVVLVAASYLGAVSHSLTALDSLDRRGLDIAALVISQPSADAQDPQHLAGEVARWSSIPCHAVAYGASAAGVAEALLSD